MDKNGNLTSVDTYDSDFTVEEIEEQTQNHFEEMKELMECDAVCGNCNWFNGEVGDGVQFCDQLDNEVSEKFRCNRFWGR